MWQIIPFPLLFTIAAAMLIPEDTEVLEGFAPSDIRSDILPEDDYFEARSLSEGTLFKAIRNKRDLNYEVLESSGLRSHFRPNNVNPFKTIFVKKLHPDRLANSAEIPSSVKTESSDKMIESAPVRKVRSTENETTETVPAINSSNSPETLPTAQKQFMKNNPINTEIKSASSLVSRWTHSPFEYTKIHQEEDSIADSSSINEGIKGRTPRVSFVTQQKKNGDRYDDSKTSGTKPEYYKSPPLIHNSKDGTEQIAESTPVRPAYPDYSYRDREMEKFMNHYDGRYMSDPLYPPGPIDPLPEYRRFYDLYDGYMPRTPTYPDRYYEYPDSRNDVPNPRDYPPIYSNDLDDRYYMRSDLIPPSRNRRIIYYANLPEVVRTPPSVDLRYRSYDRYDPYYDPYAARMMSAYRKPRLERQMAPREYGMPNRRLLEVKGIRDQKNDKKTELNKEVEVDRKDHLPITREYSYRPGSSYYQ